MNLEYSNVETAAKQPQTEAGAYEVPAIESVITPESLEREVQYAGISVGSGAAG